MDNTKTTTGTGGTRPVGVQAVMPVAYREWQIETFDKMRDALWQITTTKTLQEAHDLAWKALNE